MFYETLLGEVLRGFSTVFSELARMISAIAPTGLVVWLIHSFRPQLATLLERIDSYKHSAFGEISAKGQLLIQQKVALGLSS